MIHTEVGRWVFTPPLGKLVYKTYVDDVDTGVTADLLKSDLVASLTPVHCHIGGRCGIESRDGGGQEAKSESSSKHDGIRLIIKDER